MKRVNRTLNDVIFRFIEEKRRHGSSGNDLLSRLLRARDTEGDGEGMTDQQLRDELMTLFLAGQETTALALAWTWHLLMRHPVEYQRLLAEVDTVCDERDPSPTDYPHLKFTEAAVLETMRIYPPAYLLGRQSLRDLIIAGRPVRRGETLFMCQWLLQRDARYFPEPLRFRPERWLDGSTKQNPHYAYFPFGGGPRICIGNTFAMMESVMVLATIARRFRFQPMSSGPMPMLPSITLRMARPLDVTIHSRKSS